MANRRGEQYKPPLVLQLRRSSRSRLALKVRRLLVSLKLTGTPARIHHVLAKLESSETPATQQERASLILSTLYCSGVCSGGTTIADIIPFMVRTFAVNAEIVKTIRAAIDHQLIPSSKAEESVIHEVFLHEILSRMPNIQPQLLQYIKQRSAKWLTGVYLDVLQPDVASYVLENYLEVGTPVLFEVGFVWLKALSNAIRNGGIALDSLSSTKQFVDLSPIKAKLQRPLFSVRDIHVSCNKAVINRICCSLNSKLNWNEYTCIGFDLDDTLLVYKNWNELLFQYTLKRFGARPEYKQLFKEVRKHRYDLKSSLEGVGSVVDTCNGNVLSLDSSGDVAGVRHAGKELVTSEVERCYKDVDLSSARFIFIHTLTEATCIQLLNYVALMVDSHTAKWDQLCNDLFSDLGFVLSLYNPENADTTLLKYPHRFVAKQSATLDLLRRMKAAGKKLFIITNATYEHCDALMTYSYDKSWQQLFEFVVVNAKKDAFFNVPEATKEATSIANNHCLQNGDQPKVLSNGVVVSGGDCRTLGSTVVGKTLYFGDHVQQDIVNASTMGWDCIAVLRDFDKPKKSPLLAQNRSPSKLAALLLEHAHGCVGGLDQWVKTVSSVS